MIVKLQHVNMAYVEMVGDGSGRGTGRERGRAHPFEISPPPRLSRKSALRAGSSILTHPFETTGGGGVYLEKVC